MILIPRSFETTDSAIVTLLESKGLTALYVLKNKNNHRKPIFLFKDGNKLRKVVDLYNKGITTF